MDRIDKYIEQAKKGELLSSAVIKLICLQLKEILIKEPNIVAVSRP